VQFSYNGNISGSMTVVTGLDFAASIVIGLDLGTRIGGDLSIATLETAGGTSNVSLLHGTVGGAFKLTGSAGITNAVLNDSFFFGPVVADLGAGNDFYRLDDLATAGSGVFYGPLTLRGGAGNDKFQIGGTTASDILVFHSRVLLDGGAGTDTVTQGTMVTATVPISMVNFP
jgi:hypothetical protein